MQQSFYTRVIIFTALFFFTAGSLLAQLQPATMRQIQSLLDEKGSRTAVQRKISSQLLQATREFRGQRMVAGVDLDSAKVEADSKGTVTVDIKAIVTEKLISGIKALGVVIIYSSPQYNTIRAEMNLSKVETVAAFPEVSFIKPAVQARTVGTNRTAKDPKTPVMLHTGKVFTGFMPRKLSFEERSLRITHALQKYMQKTGNFNVAEAQSGAVVSEGDFAHRAGDARNKYGYQGQGVRIGVLSDSYNALNGAATDVAKGELPGPGNPLGNTTAVTVLEDYPGGGDEGRAMLQIIHDLAPKAQLFFATAFVSEASFATNIVALRSAPYNCDIILDDIGYADDPVFQDGILSQAVNTVTANGALYFSSAGNDGSVAKHTSGVWEGDFNDTGSPVFAGSAKTGTIHNFGTAASPVNGDIITLSSGYYYTLNWADPLGASSNDYDFFVVSAAGVVKSSSTDIQNGTQDPQEFISAPTLVTGDRIVVFKSAAAQIRAFSVNTNGGLLTVTTPGQVYGHSAAANGFSVAATPAATAFEAPTPNGPYPGPFISTNQVETFSSDGPRRVFFNADGIAITPGNFLFGTNGGNVRNKPDITAADGVSTTLDPSSGLNPFYGTSAAAPHAGAIAALIKSAKPSLTSAQIRTILTTTALDIESPGYDNVSGYGILQAYQAMVAVNPTPLATLSLGTVTASESSFSNQNGILDPGEIGNIVVQLANGSLVSATSAVATLSTTTPGVTIIRGISSYGSIASSGNSSNATAPFTIGLNNSVACGTVINFYITVAFNGGVSPQVFPISLTVGTTTGASISSKLATPPPAGSGYTAITGSQTGRISRDGVPSSCGIVKTVSIITGGSRAFDAYTFTNQNPLATCITATLTSTGGIDLFAVAYNDAGFIPATPLVNYLGDAGSSGSPTTFSFNVASGKKYTLVVHAVTAGADSGVAYTLSTSYSVCAAGPACNPVVISNTTIANGATGSPYTQSFSATGGSNSGTFIFALRGNLPAGLSFSGNTLRGTPTQAGSFAIAVVGADPAGCVSDTNTYTLVIAGNPPTSVAATYGTPQSTYPTRPFAQVLQATVKDAGGNPLPGVKVVFSAPATGASGTFASGLLTDTAITNNNGVAVSAAFTANATTGSYVVTANVNGIPPANFNLTNFCPATYVVTSNADSGPGTLREALSLVCPGVAISFDQSVNYIALTSGALPVNRAVTITGPGADKLTISGSSLSRSFAITAGTGNVVNISGITFTDGLPDANESFGGGAMLVSTGTVNITGCVMANNDASLTFYGEGGAIDNEGGTVNIDRSTIYNNTSYADGGGITQYAGTMRITNSTITGNTAGALGAGGGIYVNAALTLTNCTIFGNTAQYGGNILRDGSTITFRNTIIAGGKLIGTGGTGPDIYGAGFASADYNLIENVAAGTITGTITNTLRGVKPNLLPLRNYGGTTPVLIPMSNSPVINTGDVTLLTGLDQRNYTRVIGSRADMGAVEVNYVFAITAGTPQVTPVTKPFSLPLQARVAESGIFVMGDSLFFMAPASGASGTFPGSSLTAAAVTNTAGIATSPVFTANSIGGTYNVTGRLGTQYPVINYVLTNVVGGALPVVFGATTARAINCQVQLQWKTYSEQNTRDFTVEYSRDGVVYKDLATVPARGNSTATQTYNYTHTSPADGTVYYRIRQTDVNGVYTVGEVITVTNSCSPTAIVAYPNPVRDKLIIQVGGNAKQLLSVHDVLGRTMTQMNITGGRYEINVKGWAQGLYTVTITQEGKIKYTVKVIKD